MATQQTPPQLLRRYLTSCSASQAPHRFTDVLILGSGVAGLSAALGAANDGNAEVLVVAKAGVEETATRYAQGGVAAVMEPAVTGDSIEAHVADTIRVAGGLAVEEVVRITVSEGVTRVRELTELGARWDRDAADAIHYTLEGGHSRPRILHRGDGTGRELQRVLTDAVRHHPRITILDESYAIDLLTDDDDRVTGALLMRPHGELEFGWAKSTILATGGLGRLYRETTNPAVATGDGLAIAFRAGALLQDLEFVQFHPTTLYVAGADRFLITEAVRGEGGVLVDNEGHRFMPRFHELADLAPRDVVSRAIVTVMRATGDNKVYLDLSSIGAARIRSRFPRILAKLKGFGIDILSEPIPVRPSAHFSIGGVTTDLHGQTSLSGLFAVGEVAATGLHGANRLASNSLLEGLVFGHRAGKQAGGRSSEVVMPRPASVPFTDSRQGAEPRDSSAGLDLEDLTSSLRSLLWQAVGLERSGPEMASALEQISSWIPYCLGNDFADRQSWTLQNMLQVAYLLTWSALQREESRGVHYRLDFPQVEKSWERRIQVTRTNFA